MAHPAECIERDLTELSASSAARLAFMMFARKARNGWTIVQEAAAGATAVKVSKAEEKRPCLAGDENIQAHFDRHPRERWKEKLVAVLNGLGFVFRAAVSAAVAANIGDQVCKGVDNLTTTTQEAEELELRRLRAKDRAAKEKAGEDKPHGAGRSLSGGGRGIHDLKSWGTGWRNAPTSLVRRTRPPVPAPLWPVPKRPRFAPCSAPACAKSSTPAITSSGSSPACPPPPTRTSRISPRLPSPNSRQVPPVPRAYPGQPPEHLTRHRRQVLHGGSSDGYHLTQNSVKFIRWVATLLHLRVP